jgi:importin subunit alpha-1
VHPQKVIKKDTCRILSNIAAGTKDQITALFQNFESNALVAKIVKCAFNAQWEIRKEAVWAICNILTCGTDRHMECVVSVNGIQALCNVLQVQQDATLLLAVMDAFEKLLDADKKHGRKHVRKHDRNYKQMMDECGGVDHLEELQQHPNDDVFDKANNIIRLYFGAEQDDEDQNLAPETQDAKELFPQGNNAPQVSFTFGGNSFNNA